MSGKRSKYLRKILGIEGNNTNSITRRVYRRVKKKYTKLNKNQKSKFKIENYV